MKGEVEVKSFFSSVYVAEVRMYIREDVGGGWCGVLIFLDLSLFFIL